MRFFYQEKYKINPILFKSFLIVSKTIKKSTDKFKIKKLLSLTAVELKLQQSQHFLNI